LNTDFGIKYERQDCKTGTIAGVHVGGGRVNRVYEDGEYG
jgi:hypothetical protein